MLRSGEGGLFGVDGWPKTGSGKSNEDGGDTTEVVIRRWCCCVGAGLGDERALRLAMLGDSDVDEDVLVSQLPDMADTRRREPRRRRRGG